MPKGYTDGAWAFNATREFRNVFFLPRGKKKFTPRVIIMLLQIVKAPMMYYLHPDVSMTKGNGTAQVGPYLDMPDNSASGDLWNPPDTESTMGISFDGSTARGMMRPMQGRQLYLVVR